MTALPQRPSVGHSPDQATSANIPQTSYAIYQNSDWFKLPELSGQQEISVLPDLAYVRYSFSSPAAGITANTPYLAQETSLSASIYEKVINNNGSVSYALVVSSNDKVDTLAMQGHQTLGGSNITYEDINYNFQGSRTIGGSNYTGNYYLKVDGQPAPLLVNSPDYTQNYTADAGRYLITIGNPTSQRATAWGSSWINTVQADGTSTGASGGGSVYDALVPDSIYAMADTFNFSADDPSSGRSVSNQYQINPDGSWVNLSVTAGAMNAAGADLKDFYQELGTGLWRKGVESSWDATLDQLGDVGRAIKDAQIVGKIVVNYNSNLMSLLEKSINGQISVREIDEKLNAYTREFNDQAKDYLKDESQYALDTLKNIVSGQSFALDPPPTSTMFQAFSYSGQRILLQPGSPQTAFILGSNDKLLFFGAAHTSYLAIGNYHGEGVAFTGALADYFVSAGLNLGPEVVHIVRKSDSATLDTSGVTTISFTDGSIVKSDRNPLIDSLYYDTANPDIFQSRTDTLSHYNTYGWQEGRNPDRLFDTNGYLAANMDVYAAKINPLSHYDQNGWKEGRDPSASFDNEQYLLNNHDVKTAGIDPLTHFLQYGIKEGRFIYPAIGQPISFIHGSFDAEYYLLANADIAKAALAAGGDTFAFAFQHYINNGAKEGRRPDAYFDPAYYLLHNLDVAAAHINPLAHYDQVGWKEGRDPSATFHTNAYLAANPDVAAAHLDPLTHYLQYGANEGRHLS